MAVNQILEYVLAFFLITTKHICFFDHSMSYPYHHKVHPVLWPSSLISFLITTKYITFSATKSHILSHHHKVHPVLSYQISYSFSLPQSTSGSLATQSHILSHHHKVHPVLWPPSLISFLITTKYIRFSGHTVS